MIKTIAEWPTNPAAWKLLFVSALGLIITALYFQHVMDLQPCIRCIYQRTAVFGVLLASIIGIFLCQFTIGRLLALAIWLLSAGWGAWIAYHHVELQNDPMGAFIGCEIVPRFPSWAPLHEWLPDVFAATGSCGDIDWSFAGMSMPQWMLIILGSYFIAAVAIVLTRLLSAKRI